MEHTITPLPIWESEQGEKCKLCSSLFTFFLRRHHCRSCGSLVCGNCSKPAMNYWFNKEVLTCLPCTQGAPTTASETFINPTTPTEPTANPPLEYTPPSQAKASATPNETPSVLREYKPSAPYEPVLTAEMRVDPRIENALQFARNFGIPVRWQRWMEVVVETVTNIPPSSSSKDGTISPRLRLAFPDTGVTSPSLPSQLGTRVVFGTRLVILVAHWNAQQAARLCVEADGETVLGAVLYPAALADNTTVPLTVPLTYVTPRAVPMPTPLAQTVITMSAPQVAEFRFRMMKELFSFGDFEVLSDTGSPLFRFTGNWPNKYHMSDVRGSLLLTIRLESMFAFEPCYQLINAHGHVVLTITKRLSFGSLDFEVNSANPLYAGLRIKSQDWTSLCLTMTRGPHTVARIERELFSRRHYEIFVAPGEDITLVLCAVVVLARTLAQRK